MNPQDLIEARPSGTLKLGKINRALNIIEGTTLIGPLSSNGANRKRRYSEAALKKIASMAEGLPGYLNHVKPEDAFKPRDVRDLAVRHHNVRFDPTTQTVKSDMYVMPTHASLVFDLAERFGDHIGNSLVSKGAVAMEGDTEVVHDILQLRSADLVSDPASTKGLFEGRSADAHPLTIVDLIESLKGVGMPEDIHARVAAMFSQPLRRNTGNPYPSRAEILRESSEPRSDLKSDRLFDQVRQAYAPDVDAALAAAVTRYLANPLPAPKPKPVVTLSESEQRRHDGRKAEFRRSFPDATDADYAYALLTNRLL